MFKIFIVEDDKGIAEGISSQARLWNYDSYICSDFSNVVSEFINARPDIVLMDISLPLYDGYHWCSEIRKVSSVPIIFVSSASDNMNIVMAISMGGDDFVSKPFEMNVLIAKIKALLRRTYDYRDVAELIEHNGVILNMNDTTLSYNNEKIELAKNEYRILLTLLQNKGTVVSREKLMDVLWKTDIYVDENTLNVNVNRLRKRLEQIGLNNFIQTKFGVGYIIE